MALKRRIKKLSKSMVTKMTGTKFLECSECHDEEVIVPTDTRSVVCATCVQKWIAPPQNYKKEKSDKPRGWHFMAYFEHEGIVYSKGVEVTDTDEIAALKKEHKQATVKERVAKPKTVAKKAKKPTKVKPTVAKKAKKTVKTRTVVAKRGRKNARTTK